MEFFQLDEMYKVDCLYPHKYFLKLIFPSIQMAMTKQIVIDYSTYWPALLGLPSEKGRNRNTLTE